MSKRVWLAVFMLLTTGVPPAVADSIPVFSTGVNGSGSLLADGASDPHYTLTSSADANYPGPLTRVANSNGFPFPIWLSNGPNSKWIAPRADVANGNAPGNYSYTTTFDLTGFDLATAVLNGQWATDNAGLMIILNGTPLPFSTYLLGFLSFEPFTITSGFVNGINTLEFVVNNADCGGCANPTGLRVEINGTASRIPAPARANPVPEPATLLLVVSGLAGFWLRRRSRI